jgi:F0F1-type ATP synthase membrane subunit b/b'
MKTLLLLALTTLFPAMALASGKGEFFPQKLGIQIADFLVIMIPLMIIMVPLVRRSLIKRHDDVKASIDQAKRDFEEATAKLAAAEEHIKGIHLEMASIQKSFRDMGETERRAFESEAMVAAGKIAREAEMRINQAALMARAELAEDLVNRALAIVEKKLGTVVPGPVSDEAVRRIIGDGNREVRG